MVAILSYFQTLGDDSYSLLLSFLPLQTSVTDGGHIQLLSNFGGGCIQFVIELF